MYDNTEHKRDESGPAEAGAQAEATSSRPVVAPAVDIYENAEGYLVFADLPGVGGEGIDIRYEDGELRLRGDRAERDADFLRVFKIPEDVASAAKGQDSPAAQDHGSRGGLSGAGVKVDLALLRGENRGQICRLNECLNERK